MKNGKMKNKSWNFRFLLGLAVAGALLLASCQNIFDTPAPQGDGYGRVSVDFRGGTEKTVFPDKPVDGGGGVVFDYTFKQNNEEIKNVSIDGGLYVLPVGENYSLEITAYEDNTKLKIIATGVSETFKVKHAEVTYVTVNLYPALNDDAGKFIYTVTYPSTSVTVVYTLEDADGIIIDLGPPVTTTPGDKQDTNAPAGKALNPGSYLFTVRAYDSNKYFGVTEVIQIAPYLDTNYTLAIATTDLLAVTDPDELKNILRDGIVSWVKAVDFDALASYAMADDPASDTITLYYIEDNLASNTVFPLPDSAMGGGWSQSGVNSTITITPGSVDTIILQNTVAPSTIRYNLVMKPVAEFRVTFNNNAPGGSSITFPLTNPIYSSKGDGAGSNVFTEPGTYIRAPGTTSIGLSNAEMTLGISSGTPVAAAYTPASTTFAAASKVYDIELHQLRSVQNDDALKELFANKGIWFGNDTVNSRIKAKANVADVNSAANLTAFTTIDVYFVASQIPGGPTVYLFPDSLPRPAVVGKVGDTGWTEAAGAWTVNMTNTNQGASVQYQNSTGTYSRAIKVNVTPVAEFEVTFDNTAKGAAVPATPVRAVKITDFGNASRPAITESLAAATLTTPYIGKVDANVVINTDNSLITIEDEAGTAVNFTALDSTDTAGGGTGALRGVNGIYTFNSGVLTSQVYSVTVYRSAQQQARAAYEQLKTDMNVNNTTKTGNSPAKFWLAAIEFDKLADVYPTEPYNAPVEFATQAAPIFNIATTEPWGSGLYYVGASAPTINVNTAGTTSLPNLTARYQSGDYQIVATGSDPFDPYSSFTSLIQFKPAGGQFVAIYGLLSHQTIEYRVDFVNPLSTTTLTSALPATAVVDGGTVTKGAARNGLISDTTGANTVEISVDNSGVIVVTTKAGASIAVSVPTAGAVATTNVYKITPAVAAGDSYIIKVYPNPTDQIEDARERMKLASVIMDDEWILDDLSDTANRSYVSKVLNDGATINKIVYHWGGVASKVPVVDVPTGDPNYPTTSPKWEKTGPTSNVYTINFTPAGGTMASPAICTVTTTAVAQYTLDFQTIGTFKTTGTINIKDEYATGSGAGFNGPTGLDISKDGAKEIGYITASSTTRISSITNAFIVSYGSGPTNATSQLDGDGITYYVDLTGGSVPLSQNYTIKVYPDKLKQSELALKYAYDNVHKWFKQASTPAVATDEPALALGADYFVRETVSASDPTPKATRLYLVGSRMLPYAATYAVKNSRPTSATVADPWIWTPVSGQTLSMATADWKPVTTTPMYKTVTLETPYFGLTPADYINYDVILQPIAEYNVQFTAGTDGIYIFDAYNGFNNSSLITATGRYRGSVYDTSVSTGGVDKNGETEFRLRTPSTSATVIVSPTPGPGADLSNTSSTTPGKFTYQTPSGAYNVLVYIPIP